MERDPRITETINMWLAPDPRITVREMAAAVNLSPARFSHLFVLTTGVLPGEFLRILGQYRQEFEHAVKIVAESSAADVSD